MKLEFQLGHENVDFNIRNSVTNSLLNGILRLQAKNIIRQRMRNKSIRERLKFLQEMSFQMDLNTWNIIGNNDSVEFLQQHQNKIYKMHLTCNWLFFSSVMWIFETMGYSAFESQASFQTSFLIRHALCGVCLLAVSFKREILLPHQPSCGQTSKINFLSDLKKRKKSLFVEGRRMP